MVLRGFQQGNLSVLIDGQRIYGACPNHMDPSAYHVDFAEIASIEVTKGPFNLRDQGSLGGSVNIVQKKPLAGFHVTPNLGAGSFGFYNPSLVASVSRGRFYGLAGYSFRRSQPYVDGSGLRITSYANYTTAVGGRHIAGLQHGRAGGLSVTLGGRLDAAASEARSRTLNPDIYWAYHSTRSTSASDVNPSGFLRLTYLLPGAIVLFGGGGTSVRLPDPEERYYELKPTTSDWVGNPNLEPTSTVTARFGAFGRPLPHGRGSDPSRDRQGAVFK